MVLYGIGGAKRDRTADLLNAIQALSQLSYNPNDDKKYRESFFKCQTIFFACEIFHALLG